MTADNVSKLAATQINIGNVPTDNASKIAAT